MITSFSIAQAQQSTPGQPIDLPEFIVTGKERIEVPSSAKQPPSKPLALKAQLLDSLNPTEKQPLPKLPAHALPTPKRTFSMWPGYIEASIGSYITPSILAGYSLKAGGYRFDISGNAEAATNAWVPNAEYFKTELHLLSSYTATPEFILFAGSVTEVDVGYRNRSYKLYALPSARERSTNRIRAAVEVVGDYEGFHYQGGASFASTSMNTDALIQGGLNESVTDNQLRGFLSLEQKWQSYDVGARLNLMFPSYSGDAYPFIQGSVYGRLSNSTLRLMAGAGVQSFTSTAGNSRFGALLVADLDLFLGSMLTLQAGVRSGLRPVTFNDLLEENPYVSSSVVLDAAYDVFDIHGALVLRPSLALAATVGLRMRQTERQPIWTGDTAGTFAPLYSTVTLMQIPADVRWLVSSRDVLSADFVLTAARADSVDQPYVPNMRASLGYERSWTSDLRTVIAGIYVGDRYTDVANTKVLSGYVDVRVRAEYDITSTFTAHVRADNLMANDIVLWNGYKERGLFLSGGITWKF